MPFKKQKNVLIVEDDPDSRQTYAEILISEGYHVDEAEDGFQAIEKLNSAHRKFARPYDLCILDLRIGGIGGDRVAEIIKFEREMLTPILMITGMPISELRQYEGRLKQIQGIMLKPIDLTKFLATVEVMTLRELTKDVAKEKAA